MVEFSDEVVSLSSQAEDKAIGADIVLVKVAGDAPRRVSSLTETSSGGKKERTTAVRTGWMRKLRSRPRGL